MNPASLGSNLRRDKNNNKKTLTQKPRIIPKELHACKSLIVALSDGWPQSRLRQSCARKWRGHGSIDQRRICCTISANHCTTSFNRYVLSTTYMIHQLFSAWPTSSTVHRRYNYNFSGQASRLQSFKLSLVPNQNTVLEIFVFLSACSGCWTSSTCRSETRDQETGQTKGPQEAMSSSQEEGCRCTSCR
jgi:hypothetical protein